MFGNTGSTSTGYTLSGSTLTLNDSGTSTVTVLSGMHAISAPVEIAGGSLAVVVSSSGVLGISGNVSDDGDQRSLTLAGDGSGQLILSGSNNYGGGTTVGAGTLIVNNSAALPDGSSLTVGAGGTFIFDPSMAGAPAVALDSLPVSPSGCGSSGTGHFDAVGRSRNHCVGGNLAKEKEFTSCMMAGLRPIGGITGETLYISGGLR